MLFSNWRPNVLAHVDADCFFASREQLCSPDLKVKPLCVLPSQNACVVAKIYDAKAAGITVSVGISVIRTLAKMASEYNKPSGTTIVAGRRINDLLQHVSVCDIPGVGRNRDALPRLS